MLKDQLPRLPDGLRIYAIGDIHGRIDLLEQLEKDIFDDAETGHIVKSIAVYLGDYVDRGYDSRAVIDHLIEPPAGRVDRILLRGNHDAWMQQFLEGEPVGASWLRFGGDATLHSYGIAPDYGMNEEDRLQYSYKKLNEEISDRHVQFLNELDHAYSIGDYFFCHAGIRPGIPLRNQEEQDLMWIREPFLSWDAGFEKIIVHGHTIAEKPVLRRNRIGIDTGAFTTENLTCAVFEQTSIRMISTLPVAETVS